MDKEKGGVCQHPLYGEPRFARSLAAHANPNPALLTERLAGDLSAFIGGTDRLKDDATIFSVRIG